MDVRLTARRERMSLRYSPKVMLFRLQHPARLQKIAADFPVSGLPTKRKFFRPITNGQMAFSTGYPDVWISDRAQTASGGNCLENQFGYSIKTQNEREGEI